MRTNRFMLSIVIFLLISVLGCSSEIERYSKKPDPSDYGNTKANQAKNENLITFGTNHIDEQQHVNSTLAYSNDLSNAISSIEGVGDARVFVTDKNVYVAVVLDATGRNYALSRSYMYQGASSEKESFPSQSDIAINPFRDFISVNDSSQLTAAFKQRIANMVFAKVNNIEEVHISANLDFIYFMDEFAQAAWAKEPLEKYMNQFNILVQYHFDNGKVMPGSLKHYR